MALAIGFRARADREEERYPILLNAGFVLLAVALTAYHWFVIDRGWFEAKEGRKTVRYYHVTWQRALYASVLLHRQESHGENWVPHVYRPAPYGFVRALELWTGNWTFACLVYRGFFTYWFIWGFYRFIRRFHPPTAALAGLAIYAFLYPFSVHYYMGQLTDPMSHALFAAALLFLIEDRYWLLAVSLALGIMAKETAIVLVPAYLACWRRRGLETYLRSAILGVIAVAAYLAVRLPFGWSASTESINGAKLMVAQNLGFGDASFASSAPLYQNYLQPILFIGIFLPVIWKNWKALDSRLKALFLTLVPLVFLSSLAFGWLYESRNYMPLLPLLLTMTQSPTDPSSRNQRSTEFEAQKVVQG